MIDSDRTTVMLEELKALGVRLALDDFGTGYSSLGYLRRFPVDAVKIDRTFVAELDHQDGQATIVAAIRDVARSLKLEVVAEGIETRAQLAALRSLGCDTGQGYLFARPLPADRLHEVLAEGTMLA